MIWIATFVGALVAAMLCRTGRRLGASGDSGSILLRVAGGTGLFAMAFLVAGDGMWLGALAATLGAIFVSLGGIDILRRQHEPRLAVVQHDESADVMVRRGDTMEMPVIVREAA